MSSYGKLIGSIAEVREGHFTIKDRFGSILRIYHKKPINLIKGKRYVFTVRKDRDGKKWLQSFHQKVMETCAQRKNKTARLAALAERAEIEREYNNQANPTGKCARQKLTAPKALSKNKISKKLKEKLYDGK